MSKIIFALSALLACALAVPVPPITGVSYTHRVDSHIPLAVTTGLHLHHHAPVAVAPVLAHHVPVATVVAGHGLTGLAYGFPTLALAHHGGAVVAAPVAKVLLK